MIAGPKTRLAAAAVAAAAWTGEALFLAGHLRATGSLPYSLWLLVAYLTDWTNLLVAIVCTAIALGAGSAFWPALATAAILLVGVMFGATGGWGAVWEEGASSVLTHIVTPIAMPLLWLTLLRQGVLRWRDPVRFAAFPLAYLGAMIARGASGGGWPYPDVDVARVGWSGALAFCAVALVIFVALGFLVVVVDRSLPKRRAAP